jgi:hypothetical protein
MRRSPIILTGYREGHILGFGRKFYCVFKQDFPMEFWYGLVPGANREDAPIEQMIDVRTLPAQFVQPAYPLEVDTSDLPPPFSRSVNIKWTRRLNRQRLHHCFALGTAVRDGFDFEAHAFEQERIARIEAQAYRQRQAEHTTRLAAGEIEDECPW